MEKKHGVLVMALLGNAVIFGFDNRSWSHTDNRKNNFWVLGEGPNDNINDSIIVAKKIYVSL